MFCLVSVPFCTDFCTILWEEEMTMTTAPLTEARERLSEIIDDVVNRGSQWTITRHGRPVAVVMSHDEYEELIETLNVFSDETAIAAVAEAEADLAAGRVKRG